MQLKKFMMITFVILTVVVLGIALIATSKGVIPLSWGWHSSISQAKGIAIGGFDPVLYFSSKTAKKGQKAWHCTWQDLEWRFTSEENKATFIKDPTRYIPEFGGYCAFAVSKGFTAKPDPTAWQIEKGKLYFFADEKMKTKWETQIPHGIIAKGKEKWK